MTDDRTPPHDHDAEQAVLGAMLLSRDAIADVVTMLSGADFYQPVHETIYNTITGLYGSGQPVDPVTVAAALAGVAPVQRVGGALYLHTLTENVPAVTNADDYASIVRDKATLRRLGTAAQRVLGWVHAPGEDDTAAVIDRAQAEILAAVPSHTSEDYRLVGEMLDETVDEIEAIGARGQAEGIRTGFYDLDHLTGGWQPGQMVTVAGRPGMGKSTLALDFARAAAIRDRVPTVVYSLEMTRYEILTRLLSAESKVLLSNLRHGRVSEDDWNRLAVARNPISQAPLYIDDSANLTMTEIRAKSRRLKMQAGALGLVVIDYLQLMSSGKRVENRQVEVSEFSRQIKLLAKELSVPIIALSQLNRGPEQRTNKRPLMSDLRESGSIEQDSDIVILLHREDAYEVESPRAGVADLIVAKHRNGPTQDIAVAFQGHFSRFADLARP